MFNLIFFCMVILIILVVIAVGYGLYILGQKSVKASEMSQEDLLRAVKKLKELDCICQMANDYEVKCAQVDYLKEFVHDAFFFREFKHPQKIYDSMKKRMEYLNNSTCNIEESRSVARVIEKILVEVNEDWLIK